MKKNLLIIFLVLIVSMAAWLSYWVIAKPGSVDEFIIVKPISKKVLRLKPGAHEVDLKVIDGKYGELNRMFMAYIPKDFDLDNKYPLLFALHEAEGTAKKFLQATAFNELADKENFIVIYPQALGVGDARGADYRDRKVSKEQRPIGWNTGRGVGYGTFNEVDDLAFFEQLINMLTKLEVINDRSIFIAGLAEGGEMAQKVMVNFPGVFAAAGLVSADLGSFDFGQALYEPTPLVIFNGTNDSLVPYDGNDGVLPVLGNVDHLAELNGCAGQTAVEKIQLGDLAAEVKTYADCQKPIMFYTVSEGEHEWYLEETGAMWKFFGEQSL